MTGGVRVDRITRESLDGDADAFSPRPPFPSDTVVSTNPKVSAAWFVTSSDGNFTKVRGSAGTGIRPPDAFEIAFTDNPALKPERSKSVDAGLDQALFNGRGLIEATVFFNNYDDLIVATGSFSGRAAIALTTSRMPARAGWSSPERHAFRSGKSVAACSCASVTRGSPLKSSLSIKAALPRHPSSLATACCGVRTTSFRLTCWYQPARCPRFCAAATQRHPGRRSELRHIRRHVRTPGYNVWDIGASWAFWNRLQLFGRVLNLFDEATRKRWATRRWADPEWWG